MFDVVLVANRGEIAVRVIRTLRRLGVRSVAVFSDADAGARHVREADTAVRIGPAPARDSYLHTGRILDAAVATGADAVHPGYGFLAENAAFAGACGEAGLVFVGPPPRAIEVMGDKIRAKTAVGAAGVPVVPGRAEPGMSDDDLVTAAGEIGYPVLVKPSAGGGGKGMHLVEVADELRAALGRARREAAASFGDDTLFLERFVATPRHIEVQVLADGFGTTLHLGERECSLQRRHQKIIEEAPSALLDAATRARIGASACATAASVGYQGAGTVEFIVAANRPDDYFFMEMNTRLQVEHPVTEMVTGLDLVEQQLVVAAGGRLSFTQDEVVLTGHAIEARLYAEDPDRGFLPTGGRALVFEEPSGEGVRVDSGIASGTDVGTTYDPMLAKIIAWGPDRDRALARLDRALAGTAVLGFATNLEFLRTLLADPDVRAGRLDTGLVERLLGRTAPAPLPAAVLAAYALLRLEEAWPTGEVVDPWDVPTGWRPGGTAPVELRPVGPDGETVTVTVTGTPAAARVTIGGSEEITAGLQRAGTSATLSVAGTAHPLVAATDGGTLWLSVAGRTLGLAEAPPARRNQAAAAVGSEIRSPMPGTVMAVHVAGGGHVEAGQPVLVVEAMKMEHSLRAPRAGTVELLVAPGDPVALDQVLARLSADSNRNEGDPRNRADGPPTTAPRTPTSGAQSRATDEEG
jgi:acetyl-CoA/propionyl-CoA carboxylase biotin carboxyl carrier protein